MLSVRAVFAFQVLFAVAVVALWLNPLSFGPDVAILNRALALATALALVLSMPHSGGTWPRVVACAWLCAALASGLMGLLQYFGTGAAQFAWLTAAEPGIAVANLRQRNHLASLLGIGLCALLCLAATPTSRNLRFFFGCSALVLAFASVATGSRTGLLQWVSVIALAMMWSHKNPLQVSGQSRRWLLFCLMAYPVATVVLPPLGQLAGVLGQEPAAWRLQDAEGCASRLTLWSNVIHLISLKPWFGWGWGELDYAHFATLYPGERFCAILDNAHNLPLHLAVELGIPVALGVCGLLLFWVWRRKPWAETDPTRQMAWAVLMVIGIHSLLEYPLWYGPFQLTVVLCLLLLRRGSGPLWRARWRWPARGGAVLALAALAYVAWDYHRMSQLYIAPSQRSAAYRDNTLLQARQTWLFRDQVMFAELTTTTVTQANAEEVNAMAWQMLHFSPEPRVIERLITSAITLGREPEAMAILARYREAFPGEHADWIRRAAQADSPSPLPR